MGTDIHIAVERFDGVRWRFTGREVDCVRCYNLFAILADVRNGEGFVPISLPRGFPHDMDLRV
jgi:hypothetical protein